MCAGGSSILLPENICCCCCLAANPFGLNTALAGTYTGREREGEKNRVVASAHISRGQTSSSCDDNDNDASSLASYSARAVQWGLVATGWRRLWQLSLLTDGSKSWRCCISKWLLITALKFMLISNSTSSDPFPNLPLQRERPHAFLSHSQLRAINDQFIASLLCLPRAPCTLHPARLSIHATPLSIFSSRHFCLLCLCVSLSIYVLLFHSLQSFLYKILWCLAITIAIWSV